MRIRRSLASPGAAALLAALLPMAAVAAEPPAAPTPPPPGGNGYRVGTRPPPAEPAPPADAKAEVRVFRGFEEGPGHGHRDGPRGDDGTPLAVDVGVGLTTCADGSTQVKSLDAGGWPLDVQSPCREDRVPGEVGVQGATGPTRPVAGTRPPEAPAAPGRCDPATWDCAAPAAVRPDAPAPPPR